jgi:hypothetical protein
MAKQIYVKEDGTPVWVGSTFSDKLGPIEHSTGQLQVGFNLPAATYVFVPIDAASFSNQKFVQNGRLTAFKDGIYSLYSYVLTDSHNANPKTFYFQVVDEDDTTAHTVDASYATLSWGISVNGTFFMRKGQYLRFRIIEDTAGNIESAVTEIALLEQRIPSIVADSHFVTSSDDPGKVKIDPDTGVMAVNGGYSLSEVNTGKTWIDGRPIYSLTTYTGYFPNNTTKSIPVTATDIDLIVNIESVYLDTSSGVSCNMNRGSVQAAAYDIEVFYASSNNSVNVKTGTDRTTMHGYITIWYTKTTD